jgi:hypothetical protein
LVLESVEAFELEGVHQLALVLLALLATLLELALLATLVALSAIVVGARMMRQ